MRTQEVYICMIYDTCILIEKESALHILTLDAMINEYTNIENYTNRVSTPGTNMHLKAVPYFVDIMCVCIYIYTHACMHIHVDIKILEFVYIQARAKVSDECDAFNTPYTKDKFANKHAYIHASHETDGG
jgi:hypothetical protein